MRGGALRPPALTDGWPRMILEPRDTWKECSSPIGVYHAPLSNLKLEQPIDLRGRAL